MLDHTLSKHFPEYIAAKLYHRGVDKQILFFEGFGDRAARIGVDWKTDILYSFSQFRRQKKKSRENQSYSPDSSWIAYTKDNNLYGEEVATGHTVKYTNDGSSTILNGVASWVYYEEILGRSQKAYWWSPDGKQICFFRSDESMVLLFPILLIL